MDKKEAIRIITSCATTYHQELENKNLLFLFGHQDHIESFEAAFLPKNFLHLTGIKPNSTDFADSSDFYEKCLKGQLSQKEFSFASNGTTALKLRILPELMKIHKTAKMVGEYNFSKSLLITEKMAGNITACEGFVRDDKYYIPNTALKEDIRDLIQKPYKRVLAIFRKENDKPMYSELCYTAKGIELHSLSLPDCIRHKISPALLPTMTEKTPFNDLLVQLTHGKTKDSDKAHTKDNVLER
jgi:hypothetical protein